MNFIHWHLILNRLPIAGVAFGAALLCWGILRRLGDVQKAALGALVLTTAITIVVFLSGDGAFGLIRRMPNWPTQLIELHASAAFLVVCGLVALGALSAWALRDSAGRAAPQRGPVRAVALLAVVCLALLAWASYRGGLIRHSEIQSDWKEWR